MNFKEKGVQSNIFSVVQPSGAESTGLVQTAAGSEEAKAKFYNLLAEGDILGALLFDNNNLNAVSDFLKEWHFYHPLHQKIYKVIEALVDKARVAEPLTIEAHFMGDKTFLELGGAEYLYQLISKYVSSSFAINLSDRARLVEDLYFKRKLFEVLNDSKHDLTEKSGGENALTKIEKLELKLFGLGGEADQTKGGFISLSKSVEASLAQIKKAKELGGISGISTGFIELDNFISGWQKSDLVIIAGRPSMGKTSFAIAVALNAAKAIKETKKKGEEEGVVAVFSLEMSAEQLATRIISIHSEISTDKLVAGKCDKEDMAKVVETAEDFRNLPIYIDDTAAISISTLRARARRLKRQVGLKMIVVDYLQLVKTYARSENRVQEVSEITQGLKAIAKELAVPVLALSQLSRSVESREDKRPQLQDLRESGSIEQDADIVMFLYRESYYLARTKPNEGNQEAMNEWNVKYGDKWHKVQNKAEIIIGKHRNGPIGSATLRFDEGTTKFENLASELIIESF